MWDGLFISFEGVEGSGKSTQIDLAVEELRRQGEVVRVTREPGGTPLAEEIRRLILEERSDPPVPAAELFLLQAARAQHVGNVIRPSLEAGEIVVCDRFYDSTIAYQGHARGLDLQMVRTVIEAAVSGVHPDLTIILDMPPGEGLARQNESLFAFTERNRMEDEPLGFHDAVRRGFLDQAEREPGRVRIVNARESKARVHRKVMALIEPLLEARRKQPVT